MGYYRRRYYRRRRSLLYLLVSFISRGIKSIFRAVRKVQNNKIRQENPPRPVSARPVPPSNDIFGNDAPQSNATYSAKDNFMTDCEKRYFSAIRSVVGEKYTVQPQINLASIINKESLSKHRTELFRNVDFGIFDESYTLKVLIEINDSTHEHSDRRERDIRVRQICQEAGIPLITLWTKYGINTQYIEKRLKEFLPL